MRAAILALSLACLVPVAASAGDPMSYVHANQWADAAAAVADDADPVAAKLVLYYRLMAPGAATASEIAAFIASSPDWPLQSTLVKRRDEALATETSDAAVLPLCADAESAAALERCAAASAAARNATEADSFARRAWVALPGEAAQETRFLARWSAAVKGEAEWQRFDRLAWTDTAAAQRQAARLDPAQRARAEARLAFRRDDPAAPAMMASLPAEARAEPGLVLEQARYLRRAGRDTEALAVWTSNGTAAERAAPADRLTLFWDERNILARRRLRDGDAAGAFALASGAAQRGSEQIGDAAFLAGFVALRKLDNKPDATRAFRTLAGASRATITQGRANYWQGRAATDSASVKAAYQAAAAYPSTFYGQLAALALGEGAAGLGARIAAARDPSWDSEQALDFAGRELARAAALLVSWGESHRAQGFVLRLPDIVPDPADRAMAARLATGFASPETAITVARRAGREGTVLLGTGWPEAVQIPSGAPVEAALALGIIRQESSFDTTTTSPVGARGLMQLMPATAAQVAKQIGMRAPSLGSLTAEPDLNIRLGTAYLYDLMAQYGGCVPMAVAAYNAGPGRVNEWIATNGDPRTGAVDMLDWIEQIPFGETRNYVQRVIENMVVYRAKRGTVLPHPLAQWLK